MVFKDRIEEFIKNGGAAYAGECNGTVYVRLYASGL